MRSIEASAKTRKEAIEKALIKIGAEMHEVDIEILDEGSRGIFGFGARDVRVRVSAAHLPDFPKKTEQHPAPPASRPVQEKRIPQEGRPPRDKAVSRQEERPRGERPPQAERGGRPEREGRRPATQAQPQRGEKRGPRPDNRPKREEHPRSERAPQSERGPRPERGPKPDRGPKPERAPQPERGPRPERRESTPSAPRPRMEEKPLVPISDARREELAALLSDLIRKMGIEATVTSKATEDGGVCLAVESPDSAILIGRKGRTLQSLQYLINRMGMDADATETTERIVVDIENYLDRRKTNLEDMAIQLAAKAKETGRDVRVKPLSSQERRIIHLTLQDDPGVRTFSLGTGAIRNVIISPKVVSEKVEDDDSETDVASAEGEPSSGGRPSNRSNRSRRGRGRSRGRGPRPGSSNPDSDAGSASEAADGAAES